MKLLRLTALLSLTLAVPGLQAQDDLNLPPPGEGVTQRVRIPIKDVEEVIKARGDSDTAEEDAAAFAIAAQAKGWIPEGSAGILRSGMMVRVTVMVQGQVEFPSEPQRINQSGKIGLPLLQSVTVGDMDIDEVEALITREYREFYKDPLVNIEFAGDTGDFNLSPWGYVTMMGNVNGKGPLAMPPTQSLTISGAIKLAGGLAASAKGGSIRIFRPLPLEESVEVIRVDLDDLGRKGRVAEDVSLRAGDVVYIPERIF